MTMRGAKDWFIRSPHPPQYWTVIVKLVIFLRLRKRTCCEFAVAECRMILELRSVESFCSCSEFLVEDVVTTLPPVKMCWSGFSRSFYLSCRASAFKKWTDFFRKFSRGTHSGSFRAFSVLRARPDAEQRCDFAAKRTCANSPIDRNMADRDGLWLTL